MSKKNMRHVLGLSGGKDSAALAILMHKKVPQMEYFFCDTKKELPETYEFLDRLRARLGITIHYLAAERGFDHWLQLYDGFLPSPQMRWCTPMLKLHPLEKFIGDDEATSYIAIRADEQRDGYISTKQNIHPAYPFKEMGLRHEDIIHILEDSGIGLPDYYRWRSRSGCYFCFFQTKYEWVMLSKEHPDLFEKAVQYEKEHSDSRRYYWMESKSLLELLKEKDKIIEDHKKAIKEKRISLSNLPLNQALADVIDPEEDNLPCLICYL